MTYSPLRGILANILGPLPPSLNFNLCKWVVVVVVGGALEKDFAVFNVITNLRKISLQNEFLQ